MHILARINPTTHNTYSHLAWAIKRGDPAVTNFRGVDPTMPLRKENDFWRWLHRKTHRASAYVCWSWVLRTSASWNYNFLCPRIGAVCAALNPSMEKSMLAEVHEFMQLAKGDNVKAIALEDCVGVMEEHGWDGSIKDANRIRQEFVMSMLDKHAGQGGGMGGYA